MSRISSLSFLLAASLVAAACGSSTDTAITATNDTASAGSLGNAGAGNDIDVADDMDSVDHNDDADHNDLGDTETAALAQTSSFESTVLGRVQVAQSQTESGAFEMTADIVSPEGNATMAISGRFNAAEETSEISLDLGALASLGGAESGDLAGMDELFSEPMIIRTIGDTAYASGGIFGMFSGGASWIEFEADDADSITEGFSGGLGSEDMLSEFKDDNVSIEDVGRETIDGVETTHYVVTVDRDDVAPFDVWIDDNEMMRKLTAVQSAADQDFGADAVVTVTMRYFELDEPVLITAPPADEITDGSALTSMFDE